MLTVTELDSLLDAAEAQRPSRHGGNSTITRVRWKGQEFAVKDYSAREDGASRLRREVRGLEFLASEGAQGFVACHGSDPLRLRAAFDWIQGSSPQNVNAALPAMLDVLRQLQHLAKSNRATRLEEAADAIRLLSDVTQQVLERYRVLSASDFPLVANFAKGLDRLIPGLMDINECGQPRRTLSLSDFGLHNMLLDHRSRQWVFVDLEFFGWDDAHKLVIDTLLHPLAPWTDDLASEFLEGSRRIYDLDVSRLQALLPLLATKWGTIVAARMDRQMRSGHRVQAERSLRLAQQYCNIAIGSERPTWQRLLGERKVMR